MSSPEEIEKYTRMPGDVPPDDGDLAARFLRLACLSYGGDDRRYHAEARALLAAHEDIATANIFAMAAAGEHNFVERVRFLLAHGVSAEAQSGHPGMQGRSPYELAVRAGNTEIAELLRAAGAQPTALDGPAELAAACLRADRAAATALAAADPTIVSVAEQQHGPLQRAAELGRLPAVELMVDLGFDVNARNDTTALHEAVATGDLPLVRALIGVGADP